MAADVLLLVFALAATVWLRSPWHRDAGLRGSTPPSGQRLPALDRVRGISPAMPTPRALRGSPLVLVVTCIDCPEGEVVGGFVRRLGGDLPAGAALHVVGWHGDVQEWGREWDVSSAWRLHQVGSEAVPATHRALHATDTSLLLIYDARGRWRTTYHLGMLDVEDVRHDVRSVAGS